VHLRMHGNFDLAADDARRPGPYMATGRVMSPTATPIGSGEPEGRPRLWLPASSLTLLL